MNIKDYMNSISPVQRDTFASQAGTTVGYINLLKCGARKASHNLAKNLQKASKGEVTIYDLRPDIFGNSADQQNQTELPQVG